MTAHTIEGAAGSVSVPARAARFRLWLARLRHLTVRIELDPHLAHDVGQKSYDAPLVSPNWAEAFKRPGAVARQHDDALEIERCERSYDAPVLEASWAQAIRESSARPGLLHWMMTILSGQTGAFASNSVRMSDQHIARDIGLEFEANRGKHAGIGGSGYV